MEKKKTIFQLNENLTVFVQKNNSQVGLMSGVMGFCIYFYQINRIKKNIRYGHIADSLIDCVCHKANNMLPVDIENGAAGIGLGVNYLIKNGYVEGNINDVLEKTDIPIFKAISFQDGKPPLDFRLQIQLLYYCAVRLKEQKNKNNGRYIFEHLIFRILNSMILFPSDLWDEPYSFSLHYRLPFFLYTLGLLSTIDVVRDKTLKIINEISRKVVSTIPVLHVHRLYLAMGMSLPAKELDLLLWQKHIRLLKQEIDTVHILNNEFKNNNIFIENGIAGALFLLYLHNKSMPDNEKILYDNEDFIKKITLSETWLRLKTDDDFFKTNSGLNGFCGIAMIFNLIDECI